MLTQCQCWNKYPFFRKLTCVPHWFFLTFPPHRLLSIMTVYTACCQITEVDTWKFAMPVSPSFWLNCVRIFQKCQWLCFLPFSLLITTKCVRVYVWDAWNESVQWLLNDFWLSVRQSGHTSRKISQQELRLRIGTTYVLVFFSIMNIIIINFTVQDNGNHTKKQQHIFGLWSSSEHKKKGKEDCDCVSCWQNVKFLLKVNFTVAPETLTLKKKKKKHLLGNDA